MQINLRLPPAALAKIRNAAAAKIDADAEAARAAWATPGAGQMQEYIETCAEAAAVVTASDPLVPASFPMLVAEQTAQAAVGNVLSLGQIAALVLARSAACRVGIAAIKAARRTAKLRIDAATTAAEVTSVVNGVVWPTSV